MILAQAWEKVIDDKMPFLRSCGWVRLSLYNQFNSGKPVPTNSDEFVFHMGVDSAPFALFWKLSGNFFSLQNSKNTSKKRIKKCQIFFSIENDLSFQVNIKLAVVEDPTKSIHLALFVLAML